MSKFPTTQNAKGLKEFLGKFSKNGVPSKLTKETLKSWGFSGANDASFITIMNFVGFTDQAHLPTERWRRARAALGPAVADGILEGYAELYATFPDAHHRDDSELENFFTTHTDGNSITVGRMLRTYKALADIADFGIAGSVSVQPESNRDDVEFLHKKRAVDVNSSDGHAITVNINIQLQLPSDASAETFDKFFASMKANLIS